MKKWDIKINKLKEEAQNRST